MFIVLILANILCQIFIGERFVNFCYDYLPCYTFCVCSVNTFMYLHFELLLENHWKEGNQTLHEYSLLDADQVLLLCSWSIIQDGHQRGTQFNILLGPFRKYIHMSSSREPLKRMKPNMASMFLMRGWPSVGLLLWTFYNWIKIFSFILLSKWTL